LGVDLNELVPAADALQTQAKTLVWLAVNSKVWGVIGVADTLKPNSRDVVQTLRRTGHRVILITGDNQVSADHMADQVGVDAVFAEVRPADKADKVRELQSAGHVVAMVGDGINDAPALAQADIGIAIGAGTDVAIESAEITLMGSDLTQIPAAIELSALTLQNIKQNLFWAFGYNVALIPIAAGILAPFPFVPDSLRQLHPIMAAVAMILSDLVIVANALRLRRLRI